MKKSFGVRRLSVRLKLHAAAHGAANTRPAADDARQHAGAGRPSPIAFCLNDACGHQAIIDVSSYPADTPLPWFRTKVKCAKCGARENNKFSARKPEKSSIRPPLFLAILGCQGGEPEADVCENS